MVGLEVAVVADVGDSWVEDWVAGQVKVVQLI